jgi:hypothetical protein
MQHREGGDRAGTYDRKDYRPDRMQQGGEQSSPLCPDYRTYSSELAPCASARRRNRLRCAGTSLQADPEGLAHELSRNLGDDD